MDAVDCGRVGYLSYCGEIIVKRKSGTLKFSEASGFDEQAKLAQKQKLMDGDRITTGRKSFINITGNPPDNSSQSVCAYPESEFVMRTEGWENTVKGERRKGEAISSLELLKGAFSIYPASAEVKIPMVKIEDRNAKKGVSFHYIVDILPDMVVVVPGCKMLVTSGGKSHEAAPWFGMMGMTELIVTTSGMFEKKTEVDARVAKLCEYAGFSPVAAGMASGKESIAEYSAKKIAEGRKMQEEQMKNTMGEEDLDKMAKEGKLTASQLEMARASAKAMKASGGSGAAYAMGMLANMDFSKLKDMPGLTPEQKKQLEEGMPQMMKMQQELSGGKLEQLNARMKLSEKYMAAAAEDPVMKKKMAKMGGDLADKLAAYELPAYPAPKEWARVK